MKVTGHHTPRWLGAIAIGLVAAASHDVGAQVTRVTSVDAESIITAGEYIASPLQTALKPYAGQVAGIFNNDAQAAKRGVEQWISMFESLPAADRRAVLDDLRSGDLRKFYSTVQGGLAQRLAKAHGAATHGGGAVERQKLAATDPELIFIPSDPCRVMDSRTWSVSPYSSTPFGAQTVRHLYAYSVISSYPWSNQGGTGTPGSGNCTATLFTGAAPRSVVATVTVLSPTASGNLRAWNGGTTIPLASALNFTAGQNIANTTVIPVDRFTTKFSGAGLFGFTVGDIAIWNESGGTAHVIVDVVGYFAKPANYALDCSTETTSITASGTGFLAVTPPACPAGKTRTGIYCATSSVLSVLNGVGFGGNENCEWSTTTNGSSYSARSRCCALP